MFTAAPDKTELVKRLSVPLSFVLVLVTLYIFDPNSFQFTWYGRFYYLFFIWLFFLELALAWNKLSKNMLGKLKWKRTVVASVTMSIPTVYVIATFLFGLNEKIVELGKLAGIPYKLYGEAYCARVWSISFEHLLFTVLFVASVLLTYGTRGLKRFMVSLFFLGVAGSFLMIDTYYPGTTVTALQRLVPFSASSAAGFLNWMGYKAQLFTFWYTKSVGNVTTEELLSIIYISKEEQQVGYAINWPCAGVHSLFIYTFTILLFLRSISFSLPRKNIHAAIPKKFNFMDRKIRMPFLLQHKKIHAAAIAAETFFVDVIRRIPLFTVIVVGAVGTFIVNVLRIVSICIIGVNAGPEAAQMFHSYYGELYFIVWIIVYLLVIVFGPKMLMKLMNMRRNRSQKVLTRA